jgi:hypothetical protein
MTRLPARFLAILAFAAIATGCSALKRQDASREAAPPPQARLELALSRDQDPVPAGVDVLHRLVLRNEGTAAASDIRLTVTPSQNWQVIGGRGSSAVTVAGPSVSIAPLANLAPGTYAEWWFVTRAAGGLSAELRATAATGAVGAAREASLPAVVFETPPRPNALRFSQLVRIAEERAAQGDRDGAIARLQEAAPLAPDPDARMKLAYNQGRYLAEARRDREAMNAMQTALVYMAATPAADPALRDSAQSIVRDLRTRLGEAEPVGR